MISRVNSSSYGTYEVAKKQRDSSSITQSSQGDKSKIEEIKDKIDAGEYRVDLEALSKKIAEYLV